MILGLAVEKRSITIAQVLYRFLILTLLFTSASAVLLYNQYRYGEQGTISETKFEEQANIEVMGGGVYTSILLPGRRPEIDERAAGCSELCK